VTFPADTTLAPSYLAQALTRAAFEGVEFPVASASYQFGNNIVEHVAFARRGAELEATQRRPDRITYEIPLFNDDRLTAVYGEMLPAKYQQLSDAFDRAKIGRLIDPILGLLTVGVGERSHKLDPHAANGFVLSVSFVEHNGESSVVLGTDDRPIPDDPASAASDAATAADAAMAAADPTGATGYEPVAPVVSEQLAYLDQGSRTASEVDAALGAMQSSTAAALEIFSAASAWAAVRELERLRAALASLRAVYAPRGASSVLTTQRTMALWEVSAEAYGRADRGSRIAAANAIPDELAIPAGTTLAIPPLE
jgi:hypothetical protein